MSAETSSADKLVLVTQQSYPNNNDTQWSGVANDLTANPSAWTLVVYAICANSTEPLGARRQGPRDAFGAVQNWTRSRSLTTRGQ